MNYKAIALWIILLLATCWFWVPMAIILGEVLLLAALFIAPVAGVALLFHWLLSPSH